MIASFIIVWTLVAILLVIAIVVILFRVLRGARI